MLDKIKRNITNEVVGTVVDTTFSTIAIAAGFPAVALATPFVKGLVLGLVENCYNDCAQMTLSVREKRKLNLASQTALQTFRELAEKDGVIAWQMNIDPSYEESAFEVAEHLTLEAIRQSETKKVEVLGHYYGSQFYKGNTDWQDMHQIINMAGTLSFRQIVLIRLINERFSGVSPEMFITKQSACVEINRMRDYGLWMTDMAMFKNDASSGLQIKLLKPTSYTKTVCEALMLEKISDEDIRMITDSLTISDQGEPARGITEEDYDANTQWEEYNADEEKLTIGQGRRKTISDVATTPEDTAHVHRGKDKMNDASDHAHSGNLMQGIDSIMDALVEFKQCKAQVLYQTTIDDALKELIRCFEQCRDEGGLRILDGKRKHYETVLSDLRSEHLKKCQEYLAQSEEKHEGYDKELKQREIDSWFKDNVKKE